MKIRLSTLMLVLYFLSAALFYFFIASRSLNGEIDLQMFADSRTHEELAQANFSTGGWITIGFNVFGPMLILKIFNSSRNAIFLFNFGLFLLSYWALSRNFNIRRPIFLALLFINPMLFFSTFAVNKEILSFAAISWFLAYLANRNKWYLAAALGMSIAARWQLTVFILFALLLIGPLNFMRSRRALSLLLLVILISLVYPLFLNIFWAVDEYASLDTEGSTSGIFRMFVNIQNHFGYFLVVVPKSLHLLVGTLSKFGNVFDIHDFWDDIVVMFESVAFLALTVLILRKRNWKKSYDLLFLVGLYCVFFALSPVYSPRYFFALYPICALLLALQHGTYNFLWPDQPKDSVNTVQAGRRPL